MGFGDKKGGNDSNPALDAQARMAQQLFNQTNPIRNALIGRSASFLGVPATAGGAAGSDFKAGAGGGLGSGGPVSDMIAGALRRASPAATPGIGDMVTPSGGGVTSSPQFLAYKDSADRNFMRAKDNAISRLPAGGALAESLVDLEGDRAATLTQGAGAIYGDELARAMALATGITGQSLNSLGQAAAAQAAMAQAEADQKAGKAGGLGSGLGAFFGMKA